MACTIKDIAKESGYAISTVSRVLNHHPEVSEAARDAIMAVVNKHGFVPNANARQLPKKKNQIISIIVKGYGNLYFLRLLEIMEKLLFLKGYSVITNHLNEEENEVELAHAVSNAASLRGIFFLGASIENFRTSFNLISVPCVVVTCQATTLGFSNLSSICSDDTGGASLAINHLVAKGHKKIGVLGGNLQGSYPSNLRYAGCLQSLTMSNISFTEKNHYQPSLYSYKSGYENLSILFHKFQDMTAIFAMGDVIAIGAMRALHDMSIKVPEDISVIGFDGIETVKYLTPKITTVYQQADLLAKRSVEIMLDRILFKTAATHEIIPCNILVGDSVKNIS